MTIAIFPGTFNPIHIAHMIIAETARVTFNFEKIIFITSNIPPHRDIRVAEPRHRYSMVNLVCDQNTHFESSDIEIVRKGISYTYDTIIEIEAKYKPNDKINLLIGSDAFCQLHTWKNAQAIADRCVFIIIDRPNNTKYEEYLTTTTLSGIQSRKLLAPQMDISSTIIRDKIASGESIKYLVLDDVLDYIIKNTLYSCHK